MPSKILVSITTNRSAADTASLLNMNTANAAMNNLCNLLQGMNCGAEAGKLEMNIGAVAASQTLTVGTVVATNGPTINAVAVLAVVSGAVNNQFNIGATPTESATNLAAAINASTTLGLKDFVSATSAGAVVTVSAQVPGTEGNALTTTATANVTAGGAALAGGTEGTRKIYSYGIA